MKNRFTFIRQHALAFFGVLLMLPTTLKAETAATATAHQEASPYPLSICLVSGDKLGGPMGAPVVEHYNGEEVQFCCKDCVKDFQKDPEKYLKRLHDVAAKQANTSGS